ncbi:UNVERIFIED_CONTAM: putative mitochondrial protein [Sesamum radiatum]|uniref:Mitochondrial protein n=1 Tax=Sesamum radiatum TaxID=300843 RepID=A0AAW2WKI2_SESRA
MESIFSILNIYARASGQTINFWKSIVVFSRNIDVALQDFLPTILGIRREDQHEKYLGLPSCIGRSKNDIFHNIRGRAWKRIGNWNEKLLSQVGKEMLIKVVLQAFPTYSISIFKIPDTILHSIHSSISDFWWHNENQRKIHWLAWDRLCKSKTEGLRFPDLLAFNQAMLAKQLWLIISNPTSLAARILKALYFPNTSILEAKIGYRPSYAWRSISSAIPLICAGLQWRIGSGSLATVDKLIDPNSGEWNIPLVEILFHPPDCEAILSLPLGHGVFPDITIWHYSTNGQFSVKSAYYVAQHLSNSTLMENSAFQQHVVVSYARSYLQAFQEIPKSKLGEIGSSVPHRWLAPAPGRIKINFNAALFNHTLDIGVGVVCRNSLGSCIAWLSHRFTRSASPELAEAIAAREALLLASKRGFSNLLLEGDREILIHKLQNPIPDSSPLGVVIDDIKHLANQLNCSFSIVRRSGNVVAHVLAQNSGSRLEGSSVCPPCIASHLLSDFHL